MSAQLLALLAQHSYPAIFLLLFACGLGAPLSEDLILVATGALVGKGLASATLAIPVAYAGVVLGDCCLFLIGRRFGPRVLTHPKLSRLLTPERYARAKARFQKWGAWVVFASRFLAGTRAATFLTAGSLGVPLHRFVLADALGAAVTVPATILLARAGAEHLDAGALPMVKKVVAGVVLLVALTLLVRFLLKRRAAGAIVAEPRKLEDAGP
jgi:membrane-associated protein